MYCINNTCTDAWFNLAAEEYLLKNFTDPIFMVWQNEPAVIIGKHQNVWDEINRSFVREKQIKVVRRYSGGGAVYQDEGNLNVTFIENGNDLHSDKFTEQLAVFLDTFGLQVQSDERQALTIDGLKISGSAQSIHKKRILHHATLLFSTDLYKLATALNPENKKPKKVQSGKTNYFVKSVRSPVTNISSYIRRPVSIKEFRKSLLEFFAGQKAETTSYSFTSEDIKAIRDLRDNKYATAGWNFNIEI